MFKYCNTLTLSIAILLTHGLAHAELKTLTCVSNSPITWLKDWYNQKKIACETEKSNTDCKLAEKFQKAISRCESGVVTYTDRFTITLDTSALSGNIKSSAEAYKENCQADTGVNLEKYTVESTPSFLIFSNPKEKSNFTINRETLTGGFGNKQEYKCQIVNIDTSKNKI